MQSSRFRFLTAFCIGLAVSPAAAQTNTLSTSAIGSDTTTLDPARATTTTDLVPIGWIYNALVRFAPGSADPTTLEPDLAERWDVSTDGMVWTFHLRSGVRFQGEWGVLDADDVIYSLQRAADPQRSTFAAELRVIDTVTAPDPLTVSITLKHPDPNFLGRVANHHGGNIISRKAAEQLGDGFGTHPVGTGPFGFAEHVKQRTLWATAQRKIHDDVCAVPLFDLRQVWASSPRLQLGYTLNGSLSLGPPISEQTKLLP